MLLLCLDGDEESFLTGDDRGVDFVAFGGGVGGGPSLDFVRVFAAGKGKVGGAIEEAVVAMIRICSQGI